MKDRKQNKDNLSPVVTMSRERYNFDDDSDDIVGGKIVVKLKHFHFN